MTDVPRDHDARRGERGSAVMLVAVLGFLTMALWMTAWRATHDGIRGEAFAVQREQRGAVVSEAAARCAALLRTGEPPRNRFGCLVEVEVDGERQTCCVTFTRTDDPDVWDLDAHPADERELKTLGPMPISFLPVGEGLGKQALTVPGGSDSHGGRPR
ncbi:MAG: hypothetical protein H6825_16210 [Planctomycetes bacterium]|nr:hypothetical protein [Planctomycetota bacterium]